jgi:pimeloyl-ACP methyl ester carboxylesterase/DNA-binding SARP family transcriptional activator
MPGEPLPVHFADARGARLAWQVWGEGPARMVAVPPLAQNIEAAWEWHQIREMLDRFGTFSRYVHYDKRGTGASDRTSHVPGLDERVDDLRAVMDASGMDSAHLFVQSDGGPTAIMFAATYPERVESLILFGTGAAMLPPDITEEMRITLRERRVTEWGTPQSRMVDDFAPSMAWNQEFRSWHQRYERLAASTDSLRELLDVIAEMDVREVLPILSVPTLVIHRVEEKRVRIELGRELAEHIPGARLLELPGEDHYAYVGDLDEWMPEVERFVTGRVRPRPPEATARPSVRIRTLGGFSVEVDGEALPAATWGSRMSRQLCKRLVAARGWPITRDQLIDMLWPDDTDMRKLGARLSVQLSAVRRVLGRGVVADRESVRLDLDEVSTDLEDLYRATDDAAIVAVYSGEFLPEDRYEDWTTGPRDEARTRFIAASRRLAAHEREQGDPLRAASIARGILDADLYDQPAHRLVVECLLEAGEHGEAREAHRAWQAAMAELDLEPETFEVIADSR